MSNYYLYAEYSNKFGRYEEKTNITRIFKTIEELFSFIEERKQYWTAFWNTRTIKIDIIQGVNNNGKN